jgi:hypothetical protein
VSGLAWTSMAFLLSLRRITYATGTDKVVLCLGDLQQGQTSRMTMVCVHLDGKVFWSQHFHEMRGPA